MLSIDALGRWHDGVDAPAGGEVRSVTVFVGTPPPNQTPIAFAPATGTRIASRRRLVNC